MGRPMIGRLPRSAVILAGVGCCLSLAMLADGGRLQSRSDQEPFPHNEHEGLFPSCLACHAGVPEGDRERLYSVTPEECASCHDGTDLERVDWTASEPTADNLAFTHPGHASAVREAGDGTLSCEGCHGTDPEGPRMAVGSARAESCLGCHAHRAPKHLAAETECVVCHQPVAEATGLPRNRIASFPVPANHEEEDFLTSHGSDARSRTESCAVCHARESCSSCHVNADRLKAIQALAPDSRVAELTEAREGEWPEPASHDADWYLAHGDAATAQPESCANCHARSSCTSCHTGQEATVNRMPVPEPGQPAGARTERIRPPSHGPGFVRTHGPDAAASGPRCESCHFEQTCTSCHASTGGAEAGAAVGGSPTGWPPRETEGGYHPPNFILRHGAEAFAARSECGECHSREAFCRSCHEQLGMSRDSQLGSTSFHDAIPNWLLGHGQAARRNLESCASCHQQKSCLRCHSARAGWRISPHGPGFDPERVSDRSAISCAICHASLPEGDGSR